MTGHEKKISVEELENGDIFDLVFDDVEKNETIYVIYLDMEKTQANSVLMKYKEELMPKLKPIISREMTFDYFSKQMEALKYFHDEQDKRQNLLNQMFPESYPIEDLGNSLFECYGSFLSDMCGDTDRWIDYYIYETDWGTKDMGVKLDGKPRSLKDYKDLYDIIKERYGK